MAGTLYTKCIYTHRCITICLLFSHTQNSKVTISITIVLFTLQKLFNISISDLTKLYEELGSAILNTSIL